MTAKRAAKRERQSRCVAFLAVAHGRWAISAWRLWRLPSRTWRREITAGGRTSRSAPSKPCPPDRNANARRTFSRKPSASKINNKSVESAPMHKNLNRAAGAVSACYRRGAAGRIVALPGRTSAEQPLPPQTTMPKDRAGLDQAIHEYMMAHPEIVLDAIKAAQQKHEERAAERSAAPSSRSRRNCSIPRRSRRSAMPRATSPWSSSSIIAVPIASRSSLRSTLC